MDRSGVVLGLGYRSWTRDDLMDILLHYNVYFLTSYSKARLFSLLKNLAAQHGLTRDKHLPLIKAGKINIHRPLRKPTIQASRVQSASIQPVAAHSATTRPEDSTSNIRDDNDGERSNGKHSKELPSLSDEERDLHECTNTMSWARSSKARRAPAPPSTASEAADSTASKNFPAEHFNTEASLDQSTSSFKKLITYHTQVTVVAERIDAAYLMQTEALQRARSFMEKSLPLLRAMATNDLTAFNREKLHVVRNEEALTAYEDFQAGLVEGCTQAKAVRDEVRDSIDYADGSRIFSHGENLAVARPSLGQWYRASQTVLDPVEWLRTLHAQDIGEEGETEVVMEDKGKGKAVADNDDFEL